MMSALRFGRYRFATDWSRRSAVTMATCRRYGARCLRSRRINTDGYLAGETRTSPRLLAERRRRPHLGPADPVGSTADRDLPEEERADNGGRSDNGSDKEDV